MPDRPPPPPRRHARGSADEPRRGPPGAWPVPGGSPGPGGRGGARHRRGCLGPGLLPRRPNAEQRAAGRRRGDLSPAADRLRYQPTAVQEFSDTGIPLMAAEAQLRVAQLTLLAGDHDAAVTAAAAAAAAFGRQTRAAFRARAVIVAAEARLRAGTGGAEELRRAAAAARLLASTGSTAAAVQGFLVTGRLAAVLDRPRPAVAALARAGSLARGAAVLVRLRGQVAAALAAGLRHRDREALAHCRRGLTDLARHRGGLPSVELRALA